MAKKAGKAVPKKAATKMPQKRRVRLGKYETLKLQKRIKHPVRLASVWQLTRRAALTLREHWRLFAGITLVYGLLNLLFAQGLAGGTDLGSLKDTLDQAFNGHLGSLASGLGVFAAMVGSAGNTTDQTAGAYQLFLAIIGSLAIIWSLRQVLTGAVPRVRDAYYRGMYPLIPFLLVLAVIGLQMIPLLVGSSLYSIVVTNGIAVYFIEKLLWALLFGVLALLTLYMLSSSLFALYIVTLPDMTPMKALRSARQLVRFRRWTVLRKLLFLPLLLLAVAAIIMVPIIVWLTAVAQWVFFLLTMSALAASHAYMYTFYRELLNE